MAQTSALTNEMTGARVRVRMPGKYIVLLTIILAALAVGAGSAYQRYAENQTDIAAVEYRATDAGRDAAYFNLPSFLVDLAPDRNGRTAYLKMRVSIALDAGGVSRSADQISAMQPALVERLTFFLRELRPEDFQGSEGMARVKREMLRRVNLVIAPVNADSVIVEELVIQ